MERLFDVLHIIFSNLSYYDLTQAAQVCKTWYYIANLEKQKRGPQLMILERTEPDDEYTTVFEPFYKSLNAKPAISIYFMPIFPYEEGPRLTNLHEDYELAGRINNVQYVQNVIDLVYVKGHEENIMPMDMVGLFLPEHKFVTYDSVVINESTIKSCTSDTNGDSVFQNIVDKFLIDNEDHKCILMVMSDWYRSKEPLGKLFLNKVFNCMNQRFKAGSYSLWGIEGYYDIESGEIKDWRHTPTLDSTFFGLSISGAAIASHSLVLNVDVFLKDGTNLLKEILNKIPLHSTTLAFFALTESIKTYDLDKRDEEPYLDIISTLKQSFPTLQTMLVLADTRIFGVNSHTAENNPEMLHEGNKCSILILSYK